MTQYRLPPPPAAHRLHPPLLPQVVPAKVDLVGKNKKSVVKHLRQHAMKMCFGDKGFGELSLMHVEQSFVRCGPRARTPAQTLPCPHACTQKGTRSDDCMQARVQAQQVTQWTPAC